MGAKVNMPFESRTLTLWQEQDHNDDNYGGWDDSKFQIAQFAGFWFYD